MTAHLEVFRTAGREIVPLDDGPVCIGRGPENDVAIPEDGEMSARHARFDPVAGGWSVSDLGSVNGTTVAGVRVFGIRALRHTDELVLGRTRLVYSCARDANLGRTRRSAAPPELTPRERDVLRALCRPLFSGAVFTEAASNRQIAAELMVGEGAVKQHLANLYDKFGLHDTGRRRTALANEAVARGAVSAAQLREPSS